MTTNPNKKALLRSKLKKTIIKNRHIVTDGCGNNRCTNPYCKSNIDNLGETYSNAAASKLALKMTKEKHKGCDAYKQRVILTKIDDSKMIESISNEVLNIPFGYPLTNSLQSLYFRDPLKHQDQTDDYKQRDFQKYYENIMKIIQRDEPNAFQQTFDLNKQCDCNYPVNHQHYIQRLNNLPKNTTITKPMIHIVNGKQPSFEWNFECSSEIVSIKNAIHSAVSFISDVHTIYGCKVFFEFTPNGYSSEYKAGSASIWCTCILSALPTNLFPVNLDFQYVCNEISFIGERKRILHNKCYSITTLNYMTLADIRNLDSFSIKCYVTQFSDSTNKEYEQNAWFTQLKNCKYQQTAFNALSCNKNVKQCEYIEKLANTMKMYHGIDNIDNLNVLELINMYEHALLVHMETDEFGYIVGIMGDECDIGKCDKFKRRDRNREQSRSDSHRCNVRAAITQQILDKIHCLYKHSYDIGHKLNAKQNHIVSNDDEKKNDYDIHNIQQAMHSDKIAKIHKFIKNNRKRDVVSSDSQRFSQLIEKSHNINKPNKIYSFGQTFVYVTHTEHANVFAKYGSLK
eukprot:247562_1